MRVIKLTLQYEGTEYVGWQRQTQGASVQGLLEASLARIEGAPVRVMGAGRTDAGVHALGQVASARLRHAIELPALVRALNAGLPRDIRVLDAEQMAFGFDARTDARSKTYRYFLGTGTTVSPFDRRYVWYVSEPLDGARMAMAARLLEGRHDFAAFRASGSSALTTVRTVFEATVDEVPSGRLWRLTPEPCPPTTCGRLVVIEIRGDGFLRHMVRAIAGTLVEVGTGRRDVDSVTDLLATGDRGRAGPTAPPHGLFLVGVDY